jgi:hypothetical protein
MIDLGAIRQQIAEHKRMCSSMQACCAVGDGEVAEQLLLEVGRLIAEQSRNVICGKCGYLFMHRSGYTRHPCPPPPDYNFAAP